MNRLEEIKSKTIMHRRESGSSMYRFSVPMVITEKEAMEVQMSLGYHPAGYGFYGFKATETESTWMCSHSCD